MFWSKWKSLQLWKRFQMLQNLVYTVVSYVFLGSSGDNPDRGDPKNPHDSFLGIHENPSNPFSSTGSTKRDFDPCQIPFWKSSCVADGRDDVESLQNLL